jgi:hypothetical protein
MDIMPDFSNISAPPEVKKMDVSKKYFKSAEEVPYHAYVYNGIVINIIYTFE